MLTSSSPVVAHPLTAAWRRPRGRRAVSGWGMVQPGRDPCDAVAARCADRPVDAWLRLAGAAAAGGVDACILRAPHLVRARPAGGSLGSCAHAAFTQHRGAAVGGDPASGLIR